MLKKYLEYEQNTENLSLIRTISPFNCTLNIFLKSIKKTVSFAKTNKIEKIWRSQ